VRQSLDQWISEIIAEGQEDPERGDLSALHLVHMKGTTADPLHEITLGKRTYTPQQLAEIFERKANSYAQDLPGVQTFCLWAFFGDKTKPGAQHPFAIEGEPAPNGLGTEGPHPQGLTQQAMRHTEVMFGAMSRQTQALFHMMQGMAAMVVRENETLRAQSVADREALMGLIQDKMLNDHKIHIEESRLSQANEDRKALLKYAPALLNTIMGKEVFPQSTADSALLETLVEGLADLPQEKLMMLAEFVKPEMLGPLMARATSVIEKRKEEASKLHALAKTIVTDNPERDAAGE
jgi:hypothetical protein